ncbi:OmpA family protein [Lysobacter sp. SG-8]|uniref:OmpA family protein n=1 Tax=Marilutibacter penaei TaxID=2759900 RepID=A0A7W3YFL3_9GAMM|nr:OmpA family protein [Lysobacter penaei]MBB1089327.1 OmpA family protein [Lysobacter penaei]
MPLRLRTSPPTLRASFAIPPVLAALLLLAGCGADPSTPAAQAPADESVEDDAVTGAAPPPDAAFDATLDLVNNNGTIRYHGRVEGEATRDAILRAIGGAFEAGEASGDIQIDPNATAPGWIRGLPAFLEAFDIPGAAVGFEGDTLELTGRLDQEQRARLTDAARRQFPGARLTGLFVGAGAEDAAAIAALAALGPESAASEVEQALNSLQVAFEPYSAKVSSESLATVAQAGQAIAAMPPGRRIEIAGHARGSGDAAIDEALARQRADAVKVQLIVNGANPARIEVRGDVATDPHAPRADSVTFRVLN